MSRIVQMIFQQREMNVFDGLLAIMEYPTISIARLRDLSPLSLGMSIAGRYSGNPILRRMKINIVTSIALLLYYNLF